MENRLISQKKKQNCPLYRCGQIPRSQEIQVVFRSLFLQALSKFLPAKNCCLSTGQKRRTGQIFVPPTRACMFLGTILFPIRLCTLVRPRKWLSREQKARKIWTMGQIVNIKPLVSKQSLFFFLILLHLNFFKPEEGL